jgi:hypothetical protein
MPRFVVNGAESTVVVEARSNVHNTTARWSRVGGWVETSAEELLLGKTRAQITVDMRAFDAGDFLKNRKLKKDLAVERYPEASFELSDVLDVRGGDDAFVAAVTGRLSWRDRGVDIRGTGDAILRGDDLSASVGFDLDMRTLGVTPPRILMLKVEDVVTVTVNLIASARAV